LLGLEAYLHINRRGKSDAIQSGRHEFPLLYSVQGTPIERWTYTVQY